MDTTIDTGARVALWRCYLLDTRCELMRLLREPMYVIPTLLFPALFYAMFGLLLGARHPLGQEAVALVQHADVALQPIASKLVKEIALYGGEIAPFVTPAVRDAVVAKVAARTPAA